LFVSFIGAAIQRQNRMTPSAPVARLVASA
jgi:hypothetical protein